jgi:NarL family two-component system response regulator LiaR
VITISRLIIVLLVDDHQVVRQGVRAFLETQPDVIVLAEANSGEAAVYVWREGLIRA